MKKLMVISMLVLFSQGLFAATVYKGVDPQGNVFYSDQPVRNGTTIEVTTPPSTTTSAPIKDTSVTDPNVKPPEVTYTVRIVQPLNDQTFTTEVENIPIKLSIEPELSSDYKIRLFVNAAPYKDLFSTTTITLDRLARGAYQLQAQIVPANDITRPVAQSDVVMIYQRRNVAKKPVE